MAWTVAAYGIVAAVLLIAAGWTVLMVRLCRSLARLDRAVEQAAQTLEATKATLDGFTTLAEGARALGEVGRSAAQTAAQTVDACREAVAPFIAFVRAVQTGGRGRSSSYAEQSEGE